MSASVRELLLIGASARIAGQMGLDFPQSRFRDLERAFLIASKELGFNSIESCLIWFNQGPYSQEKIDLMASSLTVGETYFFRENQGFAYLENYIQQEILRCDEGMRKHLRIWSAGCATGEEPYSIAIMLHRMRHLLQGWEIDILGSDISQNSLKKATLGVYTEWSFRNPPEWLKETYFDKDLEGHYKLKEEIRNMVCFRNLNLVTDDYPSVANGTAAQDIIFCRNVLMYFTKDKSTEVLKRLSACLNPGGQLITGVCETSSFQFEDSSAVSFSESLLDRKIMEDKITEAMPLRIDQMVTDSVQEQPTASQAPAANSAMKELDNLESCRLHANKGQLEEALLMIESIIAADVLNADSHFLHGVILQELQLTEKASKALHRTLYLDSGRVFVHFMLGNIALQQNQKTNAKHHFRSALSIVDGLNPDIEVTDGEGLTARQMAVIIRGILSRI